MRAVTLLEKERDSLKMSLQQLILFIQLRTKLALIAVPAPPKVHSSVKHTEIGDFNLN